MNGIYATLIYSLMAVLPQDNSRSLNNLTELVNTKPEEERSIQEFIPAHISRLYRDTSKRATPISYGPDGQKNPDDLIFNLNGRVALMSEDIQKSATIPRTRTVHYKLRNQQYTPNPGFIPKS